MFKASVLLSIALLMTSNIAFANHHEGCSDMKNMDYSMKSTDTDKDGMISRDEYAAANKTDADKNFKHIDANSDGKLDAAEQKDVEEVLKAMHNKPAKTPTSTM